LAALPFTTVEDDHCIAPVLKVVAQLFVSVQTGAVYDKDQRIYVPASRSFEVTGPLNGIGGLPLALLCGDPGGHQLGAASWAGSRALHLRADIRFILCAGVNLRTAQELGGWKTLSMVVRYSHLAPGHLQEAVERLVPSDAVELARN
jgi:hypothetical protein